jgi:hypothetical protein
MGDGFRPSLSRVGETVEEEERRRAAFGSSRLAQSTYDEVGRRTIHVPMVPINTRSMHEMTSSLLHST